MGTGALQPWGGSEPRGHEVLRVLWQYDIIERGRELAADCVARLRKLGGAINRDCTRLRQPMYVDYVRVLESSMFPIHGPFAKTDFSCHSTWQSSLE